MIDGLSREQFASCLNSSFSLSTPQQGRLALELKQVSDMRATARQEIFSIVLRGPADTLLPQGTYTIDHERLGTFYLFLVPVSRERDGMYYEAVFNRLAGSG